MGGRLSLGLNGHLGLPQMAVGHLRPTASLTLLQRNIYDVPSFTQIIGLLLASGCDVNTCENEHHQSPLFAALLHEYTEVVLVLIGAGRFSL